MARQAPVKLVIANNHSFGTIRLHQEKAYPERVSSTDLSNPDFTAWAQSFGHGQKLWTGRKMPAMLLRAFWHKRPCCPECSDQYRIGVGLSIGRTNQKDAGLGIKFGLSFARPCGWPEMFLPLRGSAWKKLPQGA